MADIAYTKAQVGPINETQPVMKTYLAGEDMDAGTPVYLKSDGKVWKGDASAAGTADVVGVTLRTVKAGAAVTCMKMGSLAGFTIAAVAYGAVVYLSDTAGRIADAAGTVTKPIGRVECLSDGAGTKVLWIDVNMALTPV